MMHESSTEHGHNSEKIRVRWTLGLVLIGGNLCGLLFDWEALLPALLHRPYANGTHSVLSSLASFSSDTFLPLAVTALAPRKSFLWAAAALSLTLVWSLMDRVVALNGPGLLHDLQDNGLVALGTLMLFCAPLSFIRYLVGRNRNKRAERIAQQQAWIQQQSADPSSGVWPPPIKPGGLLRAAADVSKPPETPVGPVQCGQRSFFTVHFSLKLPRVEAKRDKYTSECAIPLFWKRSIGVLLLDRRAVRQTSPAVWRSPSDTGNLEKEPARCGRLEGIPDAGAPGEAGQNRGWARWSAAAVLSVAAGSSVSLC